MPQGFQPNQSEQSAQNHHVQRKLARSCFNPVSVGSQAYWIGCAYMQETVRNTLPGSSILWTVVSRYH